MIQYVLLFVIVICAVEVRSDDFNSEEYIDPVIYALLNGVSVETSDELPLSGGIWKCGQCDNLSESKLLYSDVNNADDMFDPTLDIEIGVTLSGMKCVTVRGSKSGIVKRVVGECDSSSVTLTLAPTEHFILNVYGD